MLHRNQTQNFRTSEAPLGGSFYSFLLRPRFLYLNVGDLLEFVVDHLWGLTGVRTNRVDFTLVNICSPFTKYSHGSCVEPPRAAWPTGPALILTFAVSQAQSYSDDPRVRKTVRRGSHVRIHDNNTTQWGMDAGTVDFVSVSVPLQVAHDFGLQQPKSNELEYIYNLIGPATKSIIRNPTKYRTLSEGYEDVHAALDLGHIRERVYQMTIPQLLKNVPYHLWVFCGEVWRKAPNLVPQRMITPAVALYYFMNLRKDIPLMSRCSNDVGMRRLGLVSGKKHGVLGHLVSSVLGLAQTIKSPDDLMMDSASEQLAPALIQEVLDTGVPSLAHCSDVATIRANALMLVLNLSGRSEKDSIISKLLFPPEYAAFALLASDPEYLTAIESLGSTQ